MRRYIRFVLLLCLAILIIWWFGRKLNWSQVGASIREASGWWLVSATVVVSATYLLRAFRWRALLAPITESSLRELFLATSVGFGANFIFGRAGEVVRPAILPLRDRRIHPGASFATIAVERLYDIAAVVILFALNLFWFDAPLDRVAGLARGRAGGIALWLFQHGALTGLTLLCLTMIGLIGLAGFRSKSAAIVSSLDRVLLRRTFMPAKLRRGVIHVLEHLASALGVLATARELVITIGWTAVIWIAIVCADWMALRAFGLPFGIGAAIFVMTWGLVGSMVPTPGGAAGAFHAAMAAGLILLDVAKDKAAAIAIMTQLILFAPGVGFSVYYLLRGDINLARLREKVRPEDLEQAIEDEKLIASKVSAGAIIPTAGLEAGKARSEMNA